MIACPDFAGGRRGRRWRGRTHIELDFAHELVRARKFQMLERESELLLLPVQQAEVEVRLRVIRAQVDGAEEALLRFVELPLLEEDQSEVGVEDEDVGVLADQSSINDLGLGERVRLEVNEAEEVQHVGVVGPEPLRGFELPARFSVTSFLKRFPSAVVVQKKNALVERRRHSGITLRHARAIVRQSASGSGPGKPAPALCPLRLSLSVIPGRGTLRRGSAPRWEPRRRSRRAASCRRAVRRT